MVSPLLFILFLNEYIAMFKENCKGKGIQIESITEVQTLLYADDIMANVSDTIGGLQKETEQLVKKLNSWQIFCGLYSMRVNLSKTKVMVFRRAGTLNKNEKWYFAGQQIEVVNCYKYLGMWFTPRLSWWKARQHLASQGKKAMLSLLRFVCKHKINCNQALYSFDHMVAPILYYGAEIWGFEPVECIENVQLSFCKKLLSISTSVSNVDVLGGLGRFVLSITYMKRCIMYWIKLVSMSNHRYPRKCYNMLFQLDEVGRKTWEFCCIFMVFLVSGRLKV